MADERVTQHHETSSSMGLIVGILIVLLVLALLFFFRPFGLGGGANTSGQQAPQSESMGGEGGEGGEINVQVPEEIDVNTNTGGADN